MKRGRGVGIVPRGGWGRIPTGGFPNIVFNFLKAARDPETASPGAGDPGARRAGEPGQSLPIPATPASECGGETQAWREAGQVPRAVPKALKSKTFATQEELRQRDCRLCSGKALHSSHSLVARGPTGLGSSVAAAPFERLAERRAQARRTALSAILPRPGLQQPGTVASPVSEPNWALRRPLCPPPGHSAASVSPA